MTTNDQLAYVLLYCAQIDLSITVLETIEIKQRLEEKAAYKTVLAVFESDNPKAQIDRVIAICKTFENQEGLIQEMQNLFNADGKFNTLENHLLNGLKRVM